MGSFESLTPYLRDQLTENPSRPGNFYGQARDAKASIHEARSIGDLRAERAAAAAYGGVVKRWRRWLIEQITEVALAGHDTSRDSVRGWQRQVFGQSIASGGLSRYATPERSGGGRSAPMRQNEGLELEAAAFYQEHKDDVKKV